MYMPKYYFSDIQKSPFRSYGFSIAIDTFFETVGKGVCILRVDTGRYCSA